MITVRPSVMEKRLKQANKLSAKNNGKLPNPWKMIQQGHGGLYRYMQRHPEEFSHLESEDAVKQDPKSQTNFNIAIREEHLTKARKLASKNGGVLQSHKWLIKHGHTRLASYVKIYPDIFVDLGQKTLTFKKRRKH